MNVVSFIAGSVSTTALLGLIAFLMKTWVAARIESSVKHEYDLKLGDYHRQNEIRTRAELVSELMAEWVSVDINYKRLNQLSLQAFLWLPHELAEDLSRTLSHKPDAPSLREVIVRVRKHLLNADDRLVSDSVVVFSQVNGA